MITLLLKCCFCPGVIRMLVTTYHNEKQYQLPGNVNCPSCKTRIVAGRKLDVIPTSEEQYNLFNGITEPEPAVIGIDERVEMTRAEFERISAILQERFRVKRSDLGEITERK
jgi:hypothetical protein